MKDEHGRKIDYLRVSVTDRCNLRCSYCMPRTGVQAISHRQILTLEEILRLCGIFASLGVEKIKVTGGEPLVRGGVPEFIARLKATPGIRQVTMTSNGVALAEHIKKLADAGLDGINISLDTQNREMFAELAGIDALDKALAGMNAAVASGIFVKINCVPIRGVNDGELARLALLAKETVSAVRFIELMPVGLGANFEGVSFEEIRELIEAEHGALSPYGGALGNGPAKYYSLPGFRGKIGFISAMSHVFCENCNRIRLTADGQFKLCLAHDIGVNLKKVLEDGATDEELKKVILETLKSKPKMHSFSDDDAQDKNSRSMFMIGG